MQFTKITLNITKEKNKYEIPHIYFELHCLFSDIGVIGPCTKAIECLNAIASQHEIPGMPIIADLHSPSCNEDGTYKSIQCHWYMICYCVTRDGKTIHETATPRQMLSILERKCNGDLFHTFFMITFLYILITAFHLVEFTLILLVNKIDIVTSINMKVDTLTRK